MSQKISERYLIQKRISPFLDEISFWDIGSIAFTPFGPAYILTFKFLCTGLNFENSDLVTFWFSGGQIPRPLVLFHIIIPRRRGLFCKCYSVLMKIGLEDL